MSAAPPTPNIPDPAAYAAGVLAQAEKAAAERHKDPVEAIHEARVSIKRMRALWALIEPLVGRPLANRNNDALRDAARALAGSRDAAVALETLDLLRHHSRSVRVHEACALAREALGPAAPVALDNELLDHAMRVPRDSAALLALLPWQGWGRAAMANGLRRTYRQGRRRLRACGTGQDDDAFHDWRKSAKRLQYQLELGGAASAAAKAAQRRIRTLGKTLGNAHDLAMLRPRLAAIEARLPPPASRALRTVLERTLRRLYDSALLTGLAFYHEQPAAWCKGLRDESAPRAEGNPTRARKSTSTPAPGLAPRGQSG